MIDNDIMKDLYCGEVVWVADIDNIYNEMVGDTDART